MSEPIVMGEVRFTPGWQDVLAAHRLWYRHRTLANVINCSAVAAVIMCALAIMSRETVLSVIGLGILAGLLWLWADNTIVMPAMLRKRFARDARLHEERKCSWNETELSIRSASFFTKTAWSTASLIRYDSKTVLIYASAMSYVFLPRRVLSPAEWASLHSCLPVGKIR